MKKYIFLYLIFVGILTNAQTKIKQTFSLKDDSCIIGTTKEKVELIEVVIKNDYRIHFITYAKKKYLKIIVKNDLGYGKTGSLLLVSSKKQFYTKSLKLEIINKQSAYFIIPLESNYLTTLKENGLTRILFCENVEFVIPKSDSELIKQAALKFYEATSAKSNSTQ